MDTDRQVTMFLRGRGVRHHTPGPGGMGEAGLRSPVTFEHLVPIAIRLKRLVPTETLREISRTVPTELQRRGGGGRREGWWGRSLSYLATKGHLEDVAVAATAEQEVVTGVHGDRHDLHVKEDREEQLT